jgi:large repetitive protein
VKIISFTFIRNIMKSLRVSAIVGGSFASLALVAHAQVVVVPGTSDPWLAGWPNGTTASSGDVAPEQSPVYAGSVSPGNTITWTATGLDGNGPGLQQFGPNGDLGNVLGYGILNDPAQNNLSSIANVPIDALMGVFLGSGVPAGPTPAGLDFSSLGLSYGTLSPAVDQVFYMGDGSAQSLTVPAGATRLFVATMDGFGWYNNTGALKVDFTGGITVASSVPDAGCTLAMLGTAFGVVGFLRRKIG